MKFKFHSSLYQVLLNILISFGAIYHSYLVAGATAPTDAMQGLPTILSHPRDEATLIGGRAIFTVMAQGDSPLSYQWLKNQTILPDATNDVLILTNAQSRDAGSYSVRVLNAMGIITSSVAQLTVSWPRAGDVDVSFIPGSGINYRVLAMALQPNGKVLIGGEFTSVAGAFRSRLARLNPDGNVDLTFMNGMSGIDEGISAIAMQSDGKILIGGVFKSVHGINHSYLARLHPDGALDADFMKGLSGIYQDPNSEGRVGSIIIQQDGKILVGGWFDECNGIGCRGFVRLHPDGSVDADFMNNLPALHNNGPLAVQSDGKILIGCSYMGKYGIARLQPDGKFDTSFQTGVSEAVHYARAMAVQSDGKILVAGNLLGNYGWGGIARLNTDGSLDSSFMKGLTGISGAIGAWSPSIHTMSLQADGKVVIGGIFTKVNNATRNLIARLNGDGTLDNEFMNELDGPAEGIMATEINALICQPDGNILVGGDFSAMNGVARDSLARLKIDGILDADFASSATSPDKPIYSIFLQADGKALIKGRFTRIGHKNCAGIARLNADGSLDAGYTNAANDDVLFSVYAKQRDGKTVVAGGSKGIYRVNANGSADTTFMNGMTGLSNRISDTAVSAIVIQPDDKILVGGMFTEVHAINQNMIARLNIDGSLDTSFSNSIVEITGGPFLTGVSSIAMQSDGKILVGGNFTSINRSRKGGLVRINPDGSLDSTFMNSMRGAEGEYVEVGVRSLFVQSDGKILVAGVFTNFNGICRNHIVRLNQDGSVDTAFMGAHSGAAMGITKMALSQDGKIWIVGPFGGVNGLPSTYIARLWGESFVPEISIQPKSKTIISHSPEFLECSVSGIAPLSYQWHRNGAAILEATNARLSTLNLQAKDSGSFFCIASNAYGSVTSQVSTLTISDIYIDPLQLAISDNHQLQFNAQSVPGLSYYIEFCTNLYQSRWEVLKTVTNGSGTLLFLDSTVADPQRFYRLRKLTTN